MISGLCLFGACSTANNPELNIGKSTEKIADEHEAHDQNLALPQRLAFMSGHVQAGLALYRAGEPEMAAPHLLHPVSETHAAERVGLDALGFNASLFEYVSEALENNRPASEIEPQLQAAEQNLIDLATRAGGDSKTVINFLLDTILEEYEIGVPSDSITVMGEYQDAYGFTVVAIQHAKTINNSQLVASLQNLLAEWSGAPLPVEMPSKFKEIKKLVEMARKTI